MKWDLKLQKCHGTIVAKRDTDIMLQLPFDKQTRRLKLAANECFEF